MLELIAKIILIPPEGGGLARPGYSGMRLSFLVNEDFIACIVYNLDPEIEMPTGMEYKVRLQLLYGKKYEEYISRGMPVKLTAGKRLIAMGEVLEILAA